MKLSFKFLAKENFTFYSHQCSYPKHIHNLFKTVQNTSAIQNTSTTKDCLQWLRLLFPKRFAKPSMIFWVSAAIHVFVVSPLLLVFKTSIPSTRCLQNKEECIGFLWLAFTLFQIWFLFELLLTWFVCVCP